MKTANTARLLERIQDYEKMVTKMNFERNLAKRENRFFRTIINKLQNSQTNEFVSIEKQEIFQKYRAEFEQSTMENIQTNNFDYHELKGSGDFQTEYKLKQELCVNFCNSTQFRAASPTLSSDEGLNRASPIYQNHKQKSSVTTTNSSSKKRQQFKHQFPADCGIGDIDIDVKKIESEIPIRYTFSDDSLFATSNSISNSNSCSSLQANMSYGSLFTSNLTKKSSHAMEEIFVQASS